MDHMTEAAGEWMRSERERITGMDQVKALLPRVPVSESWTASDRRNAERIWHGDAYRAKSMMTGKSKEMLTLYKSCLRVFQCFPDDIICEEYCLDYDWDQNVQRDTRLWSATFCGTLNELLVHPMWMGSFNLLATAIQYAVIVETDDRRPWDTQRAAGWDSFPRELQNLAAQNNTGRSIAELRQQKALDEMSPVGFSMYWPSKLFSIGVNHRRGRGDFPNYDSLPGLRDYALLRRLEIRLFKEKNEDRQTLSAEKRSFLGGLGPSGRQPPHKRQHLVPEGGSDHQIFAQMSFVRRRDVADTIGDEVDFICPQSPNHMVSKSPLGMESLVLVNADEPASPITGNNGSGTSLREDSFMPHDFGRSLSPSGGDIHFGLDCNVVTADSFVEESKDCAPLGGFEEKISDDAMWETVTDDDGDSDSDEESMQLESGGDTRSSLRPGGSDEEPVVDPSGDTVPGTQETVIKETQWMGQGHSSGSATALYRGSPRDGHVGNQQEVLGGIVDDDIVDDDSELPVRRPTLHIEDIEDSQRSDIGNTGGGCSGLPARRPPLFIDGIDDPQRPDIGIIYARLSAQFNWRKKSLGSMDIAADGGMEQRNGICSWDGSY
ncbi:hypothetical protein OQA88_11233 [Cercophora sp. LCS_1]